MSKVLPRKQFAAAAAPAGRADAGISDRGPIRNGAARRRKPAASRCRCCRPISIAASAHPNEFCIFARESGDEARHAAQARFRDNPDDRELLALTVENSDSVWKRRLYEGQNGELQDNGYWLLPFLTFQADCPYLVGSYAEIGAKLRQFAAKGLTTIMLDMVADDAEMQHVCKALAARGMF